MRAAECLSRLPKVTTRNETRDGDGRKLVPFVAVYTSAIQRLSLSDNNEWIMNAGHSEMWMRFAKRIVKTVHAASGVHPLSNLEEKGSKQGLLVLKCIQNLPHLP